MEPGKSWPKSQIAIKIAKTIGLFLIGYGIYNLYLEIQTFPQTEVKSFTDLSNKIPSAFWINCFIFVMFAGSGFGLFLKKCWGRYCSIFIIFFNLLIPLFFVLLVWGWNFISFNWEVIIISLIFILIFNWSPIRNLFPYKYGWKSISIIFGVILIIHVGGFVFYRTKIPEDEKITFLNLTSQNLSSRAPNSLYYPEILLDFTLGLPENAQIFYIGHGNNYKNYNFRFELEKNLCLLSLSNQLFYQTVFKNIKVPGHFENEYDVARAVLSSQYGAFPILMRKFLKGLTTEELALDSLNVFLLRNKQEFYSYYFVAFYNKNFLGEGDMICSKKTKIPISFFSSIRPDKFPQKNSENFVNDGIKLSQNKRFKEASIAFGNAIYLHPDNSYNNFLLAQNQFKAGDLKGAEWNLVKAKRLDPNLTEAKVLLGEVQKQLGQNK